MGLPIGSQQKPRQYVGLDWSETPEWAELRCPVPLVNALNQRKHWKRVYELGEMQKMQVGTFLLRYRRLLRVMQPKLVTMTRLAPRQFDYAGLVASMKHVQDAIALTLGVDDAEWKPGAVQWRWEHERSQRYGVKIRFWRPQKT